MSNFLGLFQRGLLGLSVELLVSIDGDGKSVLLNLGNVNSLESGGLFLSLWLLGDFLDGVLGTV